MLTTNGILIAFYVISAIAIVWLLVRYSLRTRRRKRQFEAAQRERAEQFRKMYLRDATSANKTDEAETTKGIVSTEAITSPDKKEEADAASTASRGTAADSVERAEPPKAADIEPVTADETPSITPLPANSSAAASHTDAAIRWTLARTARKESETQIVGEAAVALADESDYVFGTATPALAAMLPESPKRRDEIRKELLQAGYFQPHAYENLCAIRYLGIILSLMLFGTLLILVPAQLEFPVITLLIAVPLMVWAFPRIYIKNKAKARQIQIEHAMPDLLDMINMCVSQGLTLPQALKRVSRDFRPVYPEIAEELTIVCEQADVGSLDHALQNFRQRVDVPEVHSFASLIIQTERMGTSISDALTEYSDNMRESMRQRADQKANQASFKILFPTVIFLMPAVLMFLLGPAVIELSNFFGEGGGSELLNTDNVVNQIRIQPRQTQQTQ